MSAPQPSLPPLAWGQRDPEVETRFRYMVAKRIAGVIESNKHLPEIEIALAIGEESGPCRFPWQRKIWIEEVNRLMAERPKVLGAGA